MLLRIFQVSLYTSSALCVLMLAQAVGSSSTIALGAGTIADISIPSERGFYVSIFQMGVQLGPAIGPLARFYRSVVKGMLIV